MNLYAPFAEDAEEQLRQNNLQHVFGVTAYPVGGDPIELDIESLSLTFDEGQAPYVQADFEAKVPEDQAILDALDPRLNCRVKMTLGYIYAGNVEDYHEIADLHLRTREVFRPSNIIKFTACSDEARAIDRTRTSVDAQPPKSGLNEIITHATTKAVYPDVPVIVSDFNPGYAVNNFTELELEVGKDYESLIQDVMNRTGTWVRCDADRRWRISTRPTVSGTSYHKLYVGWG